MKESFMPAPKSQTKPVFGVRLSADERKALDKAAAAEDRPAAYVARRAILDWLKEKGFHEMTVMDACGMAGAFCAVAAAMCWLKVARVVTPTTKALTCDMTNFDWLTGPLIKQSSWNKRAAIFAVVAALMQGVVAIMK